MISAVVRTPKLFDGQLYSLVRDLLDIAPEGQATVQYALDQVRKLNSETDFSKISSSEDRLINSLEFHFPGTVKEKVAFHRGIVDEENWRQNPNSNGFSRSIPNAHFDELGLIARPQQYGSQEQQPDKLSREDIFSITRIINSLAVESTFVGQRESATSLVDIVAGQISDLRKLHLEMTRGLASAQKEADKQNGIRRAELENELEQQRKSIGGKENEIEIRR